MFGRNPIPAGRKVFVGIEVRSSGVRAGGHWAMNLPQTNRVGLSAAKAPDAIGHWDETRRAQARGQQGGRPHSALWGSPDFADSDPLQ